MCKKTVPAAIEDGKRNAELKGIIKAEFAVCEAETIIPAWYKEGNNADIIFTCDLLNERTKDLWC